MLPAADSTPKYPIEHLPDRGRFQVALPDGRSDLDYRLDAGVMSITHTGVPPQLEGRGIAAALVEAALAYARAAGWQVRPLCSYAARYMQRHPETSALRA